MTLGATVLRGIALRMSLVGLAIACATHGRARSPFTTDACPLSPGPRYGALARAPGSQAADSAYLASAARAVVFYWDPAGHEPKVEPQTPHSAQAAARMAREPIVAMHPWRPSAGDTAEVGFTIRRGGDVAHVRLIKRSGNAQLDRSLIEAVAEAVRWRDAGRVAPDTLPRDVPVGAGDTIGIVLRFGAIGDPPASDGAIVPFARQSRPAVSVIGNTAPRYPERLRDQLVQGDVLVNFRITTDGRIEDGSLSVLRSSEPAFTRAVLDVLPGYRFTPAMVDCEIVSQWVQLPFAFRIGRQPLGLPDSTQS